MSLKSTVKRALRSVGLDVRRYTPSASTQLQRMLKLYMVDVIFDVGANVGQSGEYFRDTGFTGKIVSFEPVSRLFEKLRERAQSDPQWHVEQMALGSSAGEAEINVSGGHAGASSLLDMTDNVIVNAPDQRVIGKERIQVATLDMMMNKYYPTGSRCFLKLDVQGYEKSVLEGGLNVLPRVIGMKIEMSLVENYRGETLFSEMLPFLCKLGFRPVSFENGWANPGNGELYQVDCILFRTNMLQKADSNAA